MSVQANHRTDAGDPDTPTPFTAELARAAGGRRQGRRGGTVVPGPRGRAARGEWRRAGHRTLRGEPWEPVSRAAGERTCCLQLSPARTTQPHPPPPVRPHRDPRTRRGRRRAGAPPCCCVPPPGRSRRRCGETGRAEVPAGRGRQGPPAGPGSGASPALLTLALLALALLGFGSYRIVTLTGEPARCAPPLELRVLTDRSGADRPGRRRRVPHLGGEHHGDELRRSGLTVYSAGSASSRSPRSAAAAGPGWSRAGPGSTRSGTWAPGRDECSRAAPPTWPG
ncbi:Peptidase C14 caspase domain-containing protein OS=Streptomyces fumanus OX=67302 GN=GCM10018772_11610 PE=4 SV=1 [Streptomyces fumanus]